MEEKRVGPPRTPVEEELMGRVAWQIQLRWFAALGVLIAACFVTFILNIQLPLIRLCATGLVILAYNALLWLYLKRLEKKAVTEASIFDRFAKLQTSLDWLAMISLLHLSGGVESPLLFYIIFHLIIASILLSPQACYLFATLAILAVGALAFLESTSLIPHVSLGFLPDSLYQNGLYIASVLFFFSSSLYISAYLATSVTINLRRKDEELLRLQQRLSGAYQRIQSLYEVAKTVSSTLDLEKVLNLIAQSAAEAMQVKACTIRLMDESGKIVDTIAAHGLSEQFLTKGPIDPQKSLIMYQLLSSGQPAIVSDTSQDERLQYRAEIRAEKINSILYVPLFIRGKAEGVIGVYSVELDHFGESDAEFLSALGSESATAIENARAYQALERADKAKSEFVRMVTHELRSPLSAVQSMLTLLKHDYVGPLTAQQQDIIQRSQRRISSLLALVRDLLELAAGKMERFKGEKKELALNEIILKVIELFQAGAEEKGLEFKVEIAPEPLVLVGIEEGLERVLMNLVSNAIKYTPSGGSVTVRAWNEDGQIKIEIADTGIGIPQEALPRIFDEFYRAQNVKTLRIEGTGLGLSIAKDVIEQHGGHISLKSKVGTGSTFYVTLPQAEAKHGSPSRRDW